MPAGDLGEEMGMICRWGKEIRDDVRGGDVPAVRVWGGMEQKQLLGAKSYLSAIRRPLVALSPHL